MCNDYLVVFGGRIVAVIGYGFALFCMSVSLLAMCTALFRKQAKEERKNDIEACTGGGFLAFASAMLTAVCLKLLG